MSDDTFSTMRRSPLSLGSNGKVIFAVALERGWARVPDVVYFQAKDAEEVRATLVRHVGTALPPGSRVVGVAPAIGFHHDEHGDELRLV